MPLGLDKNTWPLAFNVPKICDGLDPSTLFNATELDDGWTKLTVLPLPIEKLSHVIEVAFVDWFIVITSDDCVITAEPDTTEPPVGSTSANTGNTNMPSKGNARLKFCL